MLKLKDFKILLKQYKFIHLYVWKLSNLRSISKNAFEVLRTKGVVGIISKTKKYLNKSNKKNRSKIDDIDYYLWLKEYHTVLDIGLFNMEEASKSFAFTPLISIIMPTYNSNIKWLTEAIESVRKQVYTNWELCISDDASTNYDCKKLLLQYQKIDNRIKVVFRKENGHISNSSNTALEIATGEWIALLDHDDILSSDALFWVVKYINKNPDACLIYSDEDKINPKGRRQDPYFKCDWNYNLFLSQNLISHLGVYRTRIIRKIGGFRTKFEGSQDYDLALRFIEKISQDQIIHIPRVLYHWRMHNDSTSKGINKKPYASFSAQRAIKEHLTRTGVSASVEILPNQMYRVKYSLPSKPPLVSIIIPTKNNKEILHKCIKSITSKTIYSNYEIIVVNNNSDESQTLNYFEELKKESNIEVIKDKRDFNFSAINNTAVEHAKGSYICFLNDDTEVITSDWLSEMVSIAVQPNVGAVGAKLWYPNQTLQHGGVILGIAGIGSHSHKHLSKGYDGYFNRAGLIQNFSAITAACMLLSKKLFQKVGGFDEENLSVAYNDLDLCLKIQELNYRIVWTPFAELYHHESMSRGEDTNTENRKRLTKESNYMLKKWGDKIKNDPAYSPNLTLDIESYELAWPPRIENHITD